MPINPSNLVWIDLEMTGLDPDTNCIIEIATAVTNKDLHILAQGPVLAVHQSDATLAKMDQWNQDHHGRSGLIKRVQNSTISCNDAEQQTLDFMRQWVPADTSPMCGNSIGHDRHFLYCYMPKLQAYFHYRNLDVSTLKILSQHWSPHLLDGFQKSEAHKALDDVIESIEELKYYRRHFIRRPD